MKLALLIMFACLALTIYGIESRKAGPMVVAAGLIGFAISATAILCTVCR
jgi:hypothetical protein